MDDDDFGGFEAAETFKDGNGEPQTTSPAIPWAAFPTVPEIHIPQTASSEILLEQPVPSACFASSDPFTSSGGDIVIDDYNSSSTSTVADLKEQAPSSLDPSLDVPVSSLSLTENLETATDNVVKLELNESKKHLQETLSSLEVKLRIADEEKCRIKKEFEELLEKYRILETDFLKEKEDKLISYQDRYNKLQEKHKLELEDLRRAGQEALAIIVEEFKALLQSIVEQREEAIEKQYVSAVEKQAQKCEELLLAQHQRLLDMLDKERKVLEEKTEESLLQQSQKYKEMLEKCMENERQHNMEALVAAAKNEKEDMEAAIIKAVKKERERMEKLHAEEKEMWQAERNKDHEKVAQTITDVVREQRQNAQAMVKAAILEEQKRSEKAVEEAVKQTQEELMEYIKEQKRLDQVIRQRSLSSLELFLSCAQKQLTSLLHEEPTTTEGEQEKLFL
nr:coiled-coil domain-containing protein 91 isoform X2 [Pogona vitticeps]XP_020641452.1 coiled-coil domain-containing protein 91 isoform X2 [Pogona vitticeps]